MRSMLLVTLCVLPFASVSFSALIFGERLGQSPLGQEELTASTYTTQTDEYQVQVGLHLGPSDITLEGNAFAVAIFGQKTELLFAGSTGPIQAGDQIAVIGALADWVDEAFISGIVSQSDNLNSLMGCLSAFSDAVFVLGFNIESNPLPDFWFSHDDVQPPWANFQLPHITLQPSLSDSQSRGCKRPYEESPLPASKRYRTTPMVPQNFRIHDPNARGIFSITDTEITIKVPEVNPDIMAMVQLDKDLMNYECQSGAQIFVFRDEPIGDNVLPSYWFPDHVLRPAATKLSLSGSRVKKVALGDIVIVLLPSDGSTPLMKSKNAGQFLDGETVLNNYQSFFDEYCGDQMIALIFTIGRDY